MRAFWNASGNFNPVGQRRNSWNEEVGSPSAHTEEFGVSFTTFHGKIDLRINRFKTRIKSDSIGGVGNPYSYISAMIGRVLAARDAGLNPADFNYLHPTFRTFGDVALALYETIPARLKRNIGAEKNFYPRFTGSGVRRQWVTELCIHQDDSHVGLNGSGLWVVNPPWQFGEALDTTLPWLHRALSPAGRGRWRNTEWVGE